MNPKSPYLRSIMTRAPDGDEHHQDDEHGGTKRGPSQAERLRETVADAEVDLFHDPEFITYATFEKGGHRETWPIRSSGFRRYVSWLYWQASGSSPRAQVLSDFLGTLEGQAHHAGATHRTYVRLAPIDGGLVLDLGDAEWSAIEVTAGGWRPIASPSVKFLRPDGFEPLPLPVRGGSLEELRPFLNVTDDDTWTLVIGYLIGMFRPRGPYAVAAFHGEQGSAKSTGMRVLRKLVDPREALDRAAPRDDQDLAIHSMHNLVIALDNVSYLPDWLSDGLARLSTGAGFATRRLYTDTDEINIRVARPVMLNAIGDVITRSDLLDRALIFNFSPITDEGRRTEEDFWAAFEEKRPRILGALLHVVAEAVAREGTVRHRSLPRMADFARWVAAAEPALGWADGTFLAAYYENRGRAHELALDADPVAAALRTFMVSREDWEGTATSLLDHLEAIVGETASHRKSWPKAAHVLAIRLQRLAPNLRMVGIQIERQRTGQERGIRVVRVDNQASQASSASSDRDAHDANDAPLQSSSASTESEEELLEQLRLDGGVA
jgi:hypothetical protein